MLWHPSLQELEARLSFHHARELLDQEPLGCYFLGKRDYEEEVKVQTMRHGKLTQWEETTVSFPVEEEQE